MDFRALETPLQTGRVERRDLAGRDHFVAPVVLVREGVLNGGFLSAEEIHDSAIAWDGRPVTVNHPERNGEFAAANDPEFLETQTIGRIFNVEFVTNLPPADQPGFGTDGARGEVWVDEERALEMGDEAAQIAHFLAAHADAHAENAHDDDGELADHVMDVSVGYWHLTRQESGSFQGARFEQVQTDLKPDHLAILPNQEGACSVAAGCGVPRVQARFAANCPMQDPPTTTQTTGIPGVVEPIDAIPEPSNPALYRGGANANASPRTPEWEGGLNTGSLDDWSEIDLSFEAFRDGVAEDSPDASEWGELSASDRTRISARSMNGDPEADTFDEGVVLPVVVPSTDELHQGGLRAALSRAPQTDGINADETQEAIRGLLSEHFDVDFDDNLAASVGRRVLERVGLGGLLGSTGGNGGTESVSDHNHEDRTGPTGSEQNTMSGNNDDNDIDYDALGESLPFDADELQEMDDERVEALADLHAKAASSDTSGDGGSDGGGDGGGGKEETTASANADGEGTDGNEGGDGDNEDVAEVAANAAAEVVREELSAFREEIERAQDDEYQRAIDTIAANTDLDHDEVVEEFGDVGRESLTALAKQVATQNSGVAERGPAVNWAGRGAPATNGSDDDEDYQEYVEELGVLTRSPDTGGDD